MKGAELNPQNQHIMPPLLWAARDNPNPRVVSVLLEAGADIHSKDQKGRTALMQAAMHNSNPEVIATLLKAGADINARDEFLELSALMLAAMHNANPEVTSKLLMEGADVDARDLNGFTALMHAAECSSTPEIILVLSKAGADMSAKDNFGLTSLKLAVERNPNPEIVSAFLEAGAGADKKDKNVVRALMLAAINEDSRFLQKLLQAGADVHAMDYKGRTALDWAMENPSVTAREANVKMLEDAGGDKVSRVSDKMFLQLCGTGSPEVISKAIQAGSNVNAQDRHGITALMQAVMYNSNPPEGHIGAAERRGGRQCTKRIAANGAPVGGKELLASGGRLRSACGRGGHQ